MTIYQTAIKNWLLQFQRNLPAGRQVCGRLIQNKKSHHAFTHDDLIFTNHNKYYYNSELNRLHFFYFFPDFSFNFVGHFRIVEHQLFYRISSLS